MTCLGCNLIELQPIKLRDERTVCSSCPDWRLECEARMILAKPLKERQEWIASLRRKRGDISELEGEIRAQFNQTKEAT